MPQVTVQGHSGQLIFGTMDGIECVCMKGRFHYYEGYTMEKVVLPVRVMRLMGVKLLIVTNASGGLKKEQSVGDIVIVQDHFGLPILSGNNPLRGINDSTLGERFPSVSDAYDPTLQSIILELGNMNAQRDWGYAGDYVKAMYLMLQQDEPDDYVISTGETHSIREFLEIAANYLEIELTYSGLGVDEKIYNQNGKMIGRINPIHFRPTEVDLLLGDSTKAKKVLKWEPEFKFKELVKMMVKSDYDKVIKGIKLQ